MLYSDGCCLHYQACVRDWPSYASVLRRTFLLTKHHWCKILSLCWLVLALAVMQKGQQHDVMSSVVIAWAPSHQPGELA